MDDKKSWSSGPCRLFDLPLVVRERIYTFLGFKRSCPISIKDELTRFRQTPPGYDTTMVQSTGPQPLTEDQKIRFLIDFRQLGACAYEQKHHDTAPDSMKGASCVHPNMPIQLLQASRQIHEEVSTLLWSKNTILLGPPLPALPLTAYRHLTSLEVRLTSCSCVAGHECPDLEDYEDFVKCGQCHYYCKRGNGKPLSLIHDDILYRWNTLCEILRRTVTHNLDLTLICDCQDSLTAHEVVKSLYNFPILANATIRLGQNPCSDLSAIAEQAVRRLTGTRKPSFPFLKLPEELQQLVLEHTNLVAPQACITPDYRLREELRRCVTDSLKPTLPIDYISWNEPWWLRISVGHSHPMGTTSSGFRLFGDQFEKCCLQCTRSSEVCACSVRHAAYSSRNIHCPCWQFPQALFLVSKSVYRLATRVFFSQNRFVLWDTTPQDLPALRNAGPDFCYLAEPTRIMKTMPQVWYINLRWLRFVVHSFDCSDGLLDSPCHEAWSQLADMIKSHPCSTQMTIELDFARNYELSHIQSAHDGKVQEALQSFENISLLFLQQEKKSPYRDFFVRLMYDVSSRQQDLQRWKLERALETRVMGQGYNAAARGKYQNRKYYFNESIEPKEWFRLEKILEYYDERLYLDRIPPGGQPGLIAELERMFGLKPSHERDWWEKIH